MLDLYVSTFATLFVVIDPVGCAPIFAGLTAGHPPRYAAATAIRASVIASCILFVFALFGKALLGALHIELNAFRVAGGIMLFLIALDMVFEKRTQRREERVEQVKATPVHEDVSVFPMAMPMIAGPGSIATVMLMMGHATDHASALTVLAALASVLLITAAALLAANPLMRLLGSRVEAVVTRVLGVLLGALAVQYVIDGLRGVVLGG
ncbi:MAG: MarC family protein [Sphingomonadales bacterium]|nr:MarC family protein [Sphingomonadales bacterium]MDE2169571.1 MarC family protein [Sphingomonadales bacterium]